MVADRHVAATGTDRTNRARTFYHPIDFNHIRRGWHFTWHIYTRDTHVERER